VLTQLPLVTSRALQKLKGDLDSCGILGEKRSDPLLQKDSTL
jgi:hypothetical protein